MTVSPLRRKMAAQLLPATLLFAGLVLGGPGFTEDVSTPLATYPDREYCKYDPPSCINTGTNENLYAPIYAPADGIEVVALED